MKIRHGPATVTDDERRIERPLSEPSDGKVAASRMIRKSGYQKAHSSRSFEGRSKPHWLQGPASSRDGLFLLGTLTMAHRLVLVRHARPAAEYVGRLVGATDPPLDAAGQSRPAPWPPPSGGSPRAAAFAAPWNDAGRRPRPLPAT